MNADGSGAVNISNDSFGEDTAPVWSPDGRKIAFQRRLLGQSLEVFTMNPDGSAQRNVTNHADGDFVPAWRPR